VSHASARAPRRPILLVALDVLRRSLGMPHIVFMLLFLHLTPYLPHYNLGRRHFC
jgi:hypothetical protein